VDGNKKAKLSDFGMSRILNQNNNYYKPEITTGIPVRWAAPESMEYHKFTTASDMWSFCVTQWEVLSFGKVPFHWLSNKEVVDTISQGGRLTQPPNCPDKLWSMIMSGWEIDPKKRPSFWTMFQTLQALSKELLAEQRVTSKKLNQATQVSAQPTAFYGNSDYN
jgi:serine/threonine protein kinase